MSGHRGVAGMLNKFQRISFVFFSARDKIRRLVERCDLCLTIEKSIKPRKVVFKEFRGDNGVYRFPSDSSHSAVLETDDMREVPNLMPTPTVMPDDPTDLISTRTGTSSFREDNMSNNQSNEAVNPIPEDQAELENGIMENNTSGGVEAPPPPLSLCLEEVDLDMKMQNKFMETLDRDRVNQSISNTGSDIILEPDINMDTSDVTRTQK